jgi:maltooligosyltrehalose trehalohydrolase
MSQILNKLWELDLGANRNAEACTFKVWAPNLDSLSVQVEGKESFVMAKDQQGYFTCRAEGVREGDCYFYIFENGQKRPDPVSRSLPKGVHGPTEIVDVQAFEWQDSLWKGLELRELIFYELHVGTFSQEGTFDAVCNKLDYLSDLGINCIEIMPVAQFPGRWNWGYDGASLYAPYSGYGGENALKRLVNACHQRGIAVCLDVVYNHLGPEGNYLAEFGPYFSNTYHTPWGWAFNYDGAYSDEVRSYIIKNALYWYVEYHIDVLRLDAIHGIYDFSATPMLKELALHVHQMALLLDKKIHVVAESDRNDSRVMRPLEEWGYDLSGLWNDEYHHALHVALTNEQNSYYQDFTGIPDLAKALSNAYVYEGQYSKFRKKRHGNSFQGIALDHFIIFAQNHDQVGNRPKGDRLSTIVGKERLKIAACMIVLAPSIPLLFMGEEYGEKTPFEYFVDYQDEELMRLVHEGRKKEMGREEMPYPGEESFFHSKLKWKRDQEIYALYCKLIAIRKNNLPKRGIVGSEVEVVYSMEEEFIAWEFLTEKKEWLAVFCYLGREKNLEVTLPFKHVKGQNILLATKKVVENKRSWNLAPESCLVLK